MSEHKYYDWTPTAREMADKIKLAVREHGEGAVGPILDAVADAMLAVDYPIPIEPNMTRRRECAFLIESAADWVRNAWLSPGIKDD